MSNNILEIRDICKKYPTFALKNVSFDLKEGEICGFIGRNGAGKTTTLKCIYNLVKTDSGQILYEHQPICENEIHAKNEIGLLFGGIDYYPGQKLKTIAEVTSKFYEHWDEEQYHRYLSFFSLDENKKIKELSNGMKVKFNLALALSHGAKVLLLDEPTSGLDPVSRDEVLDCFLKICEMKNTAILFSTHVISDLERCADKIVYIKNGEIYSDSIIEEFKSNYLHIEGDASQLTEADKSRIGHLLIHAGKFSGVIKVNEKDKYQAYSLSKPELEEIMLYIERGTENEESPF